MRVLNKRDRLGERIEFAKNERIYFLMESLRKHHPVTYHHSLRVAYYCNRLCAFMGLSEQEQEIITKSALLHDIGKLYVDKHLLGKVDRLTDNEYKVIQEHPVFGVYMTRDLIAKRMIKWDMILLHHENADGTGYPFGLTRNELPLSACMLRVCDSFDTMTATRGYNAVKQESEAIAELYKWSNTRYDAEVVSMFCQMIQEMGNLTGKTTMYM